VAVSSAASSASMVDLVMIVCLHATMAQNNISLTQIFHIKTLAQESVDLVDHIKTCSKDQYVIDIQA
jgi:hypothetical protein